MSDAKWTDPNLTELRVQDEVNDRLLAAHADGDADAVTARRKRRPQAAARNGERQQLQQSSNSSRRRCNSRQPLLCYRFIPYVSMSEHERKQYLPSTAKRQSSTRSASAARVVDKEPAGGSFWRSGSRDKSLRAYQFHAAELSVNYRSPPSLLLRANRCLPPVEDTLFHRILTATEPYPSTRTHRQVQAPATAPAAAAAPCVSRSSTPVSVVDAAAAAAVDSALSDYPADNQNLLQQSQSNKLLNVLSVDECNKQHRKRRRRVRRHQQQKQQEQEQQQQELDDDDDLDIDFSSAQQDQVQESYDSNPIEAEDSTEAAASAGAAGGAGAAVASVEAEATVADCNSARSASTASIGERSQSSMSQDSSRSSNENQQLELTEQSWQQQQQQPQQQQQLTRSGSKRRSQEADRKLAAAKNLQRVRILREKMAIFLDWKLHEERRCRLSAGSSAGARGVAAEMRMRRFMSEMASKESEFAAGFSHAAGDKHSDDGDGDGDDDIEDHDDDDVVYDASSVPEAGNMQNFSLTQIFEALHA